VRVTLRVTLTQGANVTRARGHRITAKTHSAEVDAGGTSPNSRLCRVLLVSAQAQERAEGRRSVPPESADSTVSET